MIFKLFDDADVPPSVWVCSTSISYCLAGFGAFEGNGEVIEVSLKN